MNFKSIILLAFIGISFVSCKSSVDDDVENLKSNDGYIDNDISSIKPKEYEEEYEVVFQDNKNNTSLEDSLLKAVGLCDPTQKDLKNYKTPACNAKFFDVHPINSTTDIREEFLVLCRSGVHGFPVRRVIVFVKEGSTFVVANTFIADLVGMEKSKNTEHKDLILQFMDPDENRFECRYVWREGRYAYEKAMKINGNKIKAALIDSMRVEIGMEINRLKLSY